MELGRAQFILGLQSVPEGSRSHVNETVFWRTILMALGEEGGRAARQGGKVAVIMGEGILC